MPETKQLLRETRDRIAPPPDVHGGLERRRRHKENVKRGAAALVAILVALVGLGGWFVLDRDATRTPADPPEERYGIFAPMAGRILYRNEADLGYGPGLWAVDPNGPTDPIEGRSVAVDVASTLVRLRADDVIPLGWSRDGTELLFMRTDVEEGFQIFPKHDLAILHADGSETLLNGEPMFIDSAAISPDGDRVVFAVDDDGLYVVDDGLYVVDADGGQPVRIAEAGTSPTFSPDGAQIAYLDTADPEDRVWVMDADGGNAHAVLANEGAVVGAVTGLQWSPAGDRIAIESEGTDAIYTVAPDGSDLTQVITGGLAPFWSADGSRIAYTVMCYEQCQARDDTGGLAVADADGTDVRMLGFAVSGPWHPGTPEPLEPTPIETPSPTSTPGSPVTSITRADGEVLRFTGEESQGHGDLVAVHPETGESRVLVEGLEDVNKASWSADGRWIAFETTLGPLWVVGTDRSPRQVSDGYSGWTWSPTGARLALVQGNRLSVVDAPTGRTTDLTSTEWTPEWSPDGTRLVFGERGGSIYSVDVRTGERSLLVRLPSRLDSVDEIEWSPDGSRLAILSDLDLGGWRLFVLNADGSDARVLVEDAPVSGLDWSPDGTRIAFTESYDAELEVWVAPADGSTVSLIASQPKSLDEGGDPEWSPDGAQIAFWTEHDEALVVDADGSGGVAPLDVLMYEYWRGGWFACSSCLGFGPPPF